MSQPNKNNKESLLRVLRMEHCDGGSNLKDESIGRSVRRENIEDEDDDQDFVNVSGNSFKDRETIG